MTERREPGLSPSSDQARIVVQRLYGSTRWVPAPALAAEPVHRRATASDRAFAIIEDCRHPVGDFAAMTGVRPGLSRTFDVTLAEGDGHPLTRAFGGQLVGRRRCIYLLVGAGSSRESSRVRRCL